MAGSARPARPRPCSTCTTGAWLPAASRSAGPAEGRGPRLTGQSALDVVHGLLGRVLQALSLPFVPIDQALNAAGLVFLGGLAPGDQHDDSRDRVGVEAGVAQQADQQA